MFVIYVDIFFGQTKVNYVDIMMIALSTNNKVLRLDVPMKESFAM